MGDALEQHEGAAGEEVGAGEADAALLVEFDRDVAEFVAAGYEAGDVDGVGSENGAAGAFDAGEHAQHFGRKVVAVGNEGCVEAVVGKLGPEDIAVSVEFGREAVAEVRAERRAGVGGFADGVGVGSVVAERDCDAAFDNRADIGDGFGGFRRDGGVEDAAVRRFHQAVEEAEVGRADVAFVVGAAGTVFGGDMGALEMDAGDGAFHYGVPQGFGHNAADAFHVRGGCGDDGGDPASYPPRRQFLCKLGDVFRNEVGGLEIDAEGAVYLDVEEGRGEVGVAIADVGAGASGGAHRGDAAILKGDIEDFFIRRSVDAEQATSYNTAFIFCDGHVVWLLSGGTL